MSTVTPPEELEHRRKLAEIDRSMERTASRYALIIATHPEWDAEFQEAVEYWFPRHGAARVE
jgi:hypothetical protein